MKQIDVRCSSLYNIDVRLFCPKSTTINGQLIKSKENKTQEKKNYYNLFLGPTKYFIIKSEFQTRKQVMIILNLNRIGTL